MEVDPDDFCPENFPHGAEGLEDEFFWDCSDDDSPLGNDTGADVFYAYLNWRVEHPRSKALKFLAALLEDWRVNDEGWEWTNAHEVAKSLRADTFSFLTRDDAMIGLAFAQIVLAGELNGEIRRLALLAVERQLMPEVLKVRMGTGSHWARIEKLAKTREVLFMTVPRANLC